MRTPKCENKPAILVGFYMVWEEVRIMLLLWFAALSVVLRFGTTEWESNVWVVILLVQSVPYAAALFTSLANVVTAEQLQTWAKPLLQFNKSLKELSFFSLSATALSKDLITPSTSKDGTS
jgi:hypothetical protein